MFERIGAEHQLNCVFEDIAYYTFFIDGMHNNHRKKIANFGGSNRSRTEEVRDALGRMASLRFPSPLIVPDVKIFRIRPCARQSEKQFLSITATSAVV